MATRKAKTNKSAKTKSNGKGVQPLPADATTTAAEEPSPLTLIALQAENVKRLRAVRLQLDGKSLVVVAGDNAQGKTSLLDAVEILLLGGDSIPAEPVTRGKKKARVVGDFGELTVERVVRANRTHSLIVRTADGVEQKPPQRYLDKLISSRSCDPLEFATMKPEKQDQTLREMARVDTAKLDAQEEAERDARKLVNRDLKLARGHAESLPHHPGVPAKEISVSELTEALGEAEKELAEQADARQALDDYDRETQQQKDRGESIGLEIQRLEAQLAERKSAQNALATSIVERLKDRVELAEAVDALVPPDTATIREQIRDADDLNRKIRANHERADALNRADELRRQFEEHSEKIEGIQAQRDEMLAAADFPVEGLGFSAAGGVTFNGLPFEQASQAERLRVSVAIAFALNPRIKIALVRDGSLLDDRHLALLGQLAQEHGGQLLVERVGDRDAGAVVIEDGSVREG